MLFERTRRETFAKLLTHSKYPNYRFTEHRGGKASDLHTVSTASMRPRFATLVNSKRCLAQLKYMRARLVSLGTRDLACAWQASETGGGSRHAGAAVQRWAGPCRR